MAYFLTDSGRHGYELEDIARILSVNADVTTPEGAIAVLEELKNYIEQKKKEMPKLTYILEEIEMPNLEAIRAMEQFGIEIDLDELIKIKEDFTKKLAKIEEDVFVYAGQKFNINSTKQLGEILFEKLGLPYGKKGKTGYSTDQGVLESLKELHPLPELVLEQRKFAKLLSTYIEPILLKTGRDGRLHTTFIATHAATGRLASRDPNLQNIPVRTDEGLLIRSLFKAAPGYTLISLDYSQIELRILAHLSKDLELISAFKNGEDIHRKTAAAIFNVFPELVDETMRRHAKAVNFGIIYGMQAFKLSQDTGVQISFAKEYIDQYLKFYKEVKVFIENTISDAKKNGFVETYFGRRRFVPEINHSNKNIAKSGERIAVNTVIQGSAADIIKKGTVKIYNMIREKKLDAKILLQIHDELIFEVKIEETEEAVALFSEAMRNAAPEFSIPFDVSSAHGQRWSML